jgi:hypothetical protein
LAIDWMTWQEIPTGTTNLAVQPTNNQTFFRVVRLLDPDALPASFLYVSASAPAGGDGSKDLPFRDLRSALNAATNHSVIQVLPGVYSGSSNCNLTVTNQVVLIAERGWEQTVIHCGQAASTQAFSSPSWSPVPGGTNSPVTVRASGEANFFRLRK